MSADRDGAVDRLALRPAEPLLVDAWRYWNTRRGARQCAARADIDPVDIPLLLPHVGLVDVEGDGARLCFRFRLVGTRMNQIFGHNFTGGSLDDSSRRLYGGFLTERYDEVARSRLPVFSEAVFAFADGRHLTGRRLILPLAEADDRPINMLLFVATFHAASPDGTPSPERLQPPYTTGDICDVRLVRRQEL